MPVSPIWLLQAMDNAFEAIAGEPFDSVLPARASVCGIAHAHTAAPDCLDSEMEAFCPSSGLYDESRRDFSITEGMTHE